MHICILLLNVTFSEMGLYSITVFLDGRSHCHRLYLHLVLKGIVGNQITSEQC